MKVFLLVSLALWAIAQGHHHEDHHDDHHDDHHECPAVCEVDGGKTLKTFGGTLEKMKLPCKYNAIRRTVCGNHMITITPGNVLETDRYKYVIRSLYVGVEDLDSTLEWEGRSTVAIAEKYIEGKKDEPFNKLDGYLKTTDVFDFDSCREDDGTHTAHSHDDHFVALVAKNGDFRIDFGIYDKASTKHRSSGFKFTCFRDFQPTDYPKQICGNGTRREIYNFKRDNGLKANRQAAMFLNIFTMDGLKQVNSDCAGAARTMTNKCGDREQQFEAAKLCYPILSKRRYFKSIIDKLYEPSSAFKHCVEFVCSNFSDLDSCVALGDELNGSPTLPGVSDKVCEVCDHLLMTSDDIDYEDVHY